MPQAIPYWQQAGQRAVERSANIEAISHLTKGVGGAKNPARNPRAAQQELALQLALVRALLRCSRAIRPQKQNRPTPRRVELCQQVGDSPQHFMALRSLISLNQTKGRHRTARDFGRECLTLAEGMQDSAFLQSAYEKMGAILFFHG